MKYRYHPIPSYEHYLKVFADHDEDMDYRHNQNGQTRYSLAEIVELGEEHLISQQQEHE